MSKTNRIYIIKNNKVDCWGYQLYHLSKLLLLLLFVADLGPFATRDPRFPLPGDMNLDIVLNTQEDVHSPENQKSLASAFLEVETNEMKKHRTLATFLYNTKIDERNNEKNFNKSQSKETFNNTEVQY